MRLPPSTFHAPGFSGGRAIGAQVLIVVVALAAAFLLAVGPRPRVARILAATAGALLLVSVGIRFLSRSADDSRPSVILISLDTVRRDRLGCYGFDRGTTPEIDRFAERAAIFEDAHSPEAWTLTAHMTLLTSLHPWAHGVTPERPLPLPAPTLTGTLRRSGYATAAVVDDIAWLHPFYGFDRGFDTYRRIHGDADAKLEALAPVLDDLEAGGPFFLLLHYFDAHGDWGRLPYEAPEEDLERFAGWYEGPFDGCDERDRCGAGLLRAWIDEGTSPSEEVRLYLSSLYDAGLAALDRKLGLLFDDLERRGLLENSIVVLTADHGEEFNEHGKWLHRQLHRECTAVPWIVRPPGGTAPRRVPGVSGLVDVAPTVLELLGIPRPKEMQGRSLAPAVSGGPPPDEPTFALLQSGTERSGLRTSTFLLLRDGEKEQLFDLRSDAGEAEDLIAAGREPSELAGLRELLDGENARARALHASFGEVRTGELLTPEDRDRLRNLGYVDGEQ